MGAGVGEEVGQQLVQAGLVAGDLDGLLREVELPRVLRRGGVRVADGVDREEGEVDRLALERPAGVEAGEEEQVLDELLHPQRLGLDPADGVGDGGGHGVRLAAGQLGVAADRGERGPQLVRGVGDELPHLRLALLPGLERRLDVVEHRVEGEGDLADLGALVGVVRRDAHRERDVTRVELEPRDAAGGGGDPVEGREAAPDDDRSPPTATSTRPMALPPATTATRRSVSSSTGRGQTDDEEVARLRVREVTR